MAKLAAKKITFLTRLFGMVLRTLFFLADRGTIFFFTPRAIIAPTRLVKIPSTSETCSSVSFTKVSLRKKDVAYRQLIYRENKINGSPP